MHACMQRQLRFPRRIRRCVFIYMQSPVALLSCFIDNIPNPETAGPGTSSSSSGFRTTEIDHKGPSLNDELGPMEEASKSKQFAVSSSNAAVPIQPGLRGKKSKRGGKGKIVDPSLLGKLVRVCMTAASCGTS